VFRIIIQYSEWIGFVFGVLQVVYAVKNKSINFIFGLIGAVFYIFVFKQAGLYAEASLNVYYATISILGLYFWVNKKNNTELRITKATENDWTTAALILIGSFVISYIVLQKYTDSTVPIWDSLVASFAWSGSWLLAKRKIESWIILNISNALAIPLQLQKGYPITSVLTIVLFVFAIIGYTEWKKILSGHVKKKADFEL
jgi:nicotinamide mononucleotide transporter